MPHRHSLSSSFAFQSIPFFGSVPLSFFLSFFFYFLLLLLVLLDFSMLSPDARDLLPWIAIYSKFSGHDLNFRIRDFLHSIWGFSESGMHLTLGSRTSFKFPHCLRITWTALRFSGFPAILPRFTRSARSCLGWFSMPTILFWQDSWDSYRIQRNSPALGRHRDLIVLARFFVKTKCNKSIQQLIKRNKQSQCNCTQISVSTADWTER